MPLTVCHINAVVCRRNGDLVQKRALDRAETREKQFETENNWTFHKIVNSSLDFLRQTKWISVLIGRFRKEIATNRAKTKIILLDVFFKFLLSTLDII